MNEAKPISKEKIYSIIRTKVSEILDVLLNFLQMCYVIYVLHSTIDSKIHLR